MVMMIMIVIIIAVRGVQHGAGLLVQQQLARSPFVPGMEVEHVLDRTGNGVERAARLNAFAVEPVVLDEAEHGALVGQGVIDMVALCERRHHQQRHAGSIAAAAVRRLTEGAVERLGRRCDALLGAVAGVADAETVEIVAGGERRVDDRRHLMVVPAVGVVIHDDDGGIFPFLALLQGIDHPHDEMLFVGGIRISSMPVFKRLSLQEADRRQIAGLQRREEVVDIVLVIGRFRRVGVRDQAVTDRLHGTRAGVSRVAGRRIVLEPGVVRDVVDRRGSRLARRCGAGLTQAAGGAVGVDDGQVEAAHERPPGDALGIEQVADVAAGHRDLRALRVGADVVNRIVVTDHGQVARQMGCVGENLVAADQPARTIEHVEGEGKAVGLARDQVESAGRRRTELRCIGIVVQRVVLRVVPHRGDGVAVEVAHHQGLGTDPDRRRPAAADEGREAVHVPVVVGALLRTFGVALIGRQRLRGRETERV